MVANNDRPKLYIYDEIGDGWFGGLSDSEFVENLSKHKGQDVDIHIDSPGGDVFMGISIANNIARHDGQVDIYIDGVAASIASVIAMAGDRVIAPSNATMMIHNPWTLTIGNEHDHDKTISILRMLKGQIIDTYLWRATISADELSDKMNTDTWLTARQAAEIGLVDTVLEGGRKSARASLARFDGLYQNIPRDLLDASSKARDGLPKDSLKQTYREFLDSKLSCINRLRDADKLSIMKRDRRHFQSKIDELTGKTEPVTFENELRRKIHALK